MAHLYILIIIIFILLYKQGSNLHSGPGTALLSGTRLSSARGSRTHKCRQHQRRCEKNPLLLQLHTVNSANIQAALTLHSVFTSQ